MKRLSYANVMSTVAVVIALGGTSYAVDKLSGSRLKDRSVPGDKIRRDALTRKEIRESTLRIVPNAFRLNGRTEESMRVACPGDTRLAAGVCLERVPRIVATYSDAVADCNFNDDRHLPTHDQLLAYVSDPKVQLAPEGEFVAPVVALPDGTAGVGVMTDESGTTVFVPAFGSERRRYHCVSQLKN
jgi:hypothetical protein